MNTRSIRRALCGLFAVVALGLAAVAPASAAATEPAAAGLPALTAEVLFAPSPFEATDKRKHLVYEISVQNTTAEELRIDGLDVLDARRGTIVRSVPADEVSEIMLAAGAGSTNTLSPGGSGVLYIDLTFPRHANIPTRLVHRFALSPSDDQTGAETPVSLSGPVQLGPPLRGDGLLAVNACCSTSGHGRQLVFDQGHQFIPQRYAIDFLRLQDGSPFAGDPTQNESYFIFGAEVIAAAPGRVVAARDGMPENTPPNDPPDPGYEGAGGNYVLIDMGGNRFAFYAHLHTGTVRVAVGDRVRRGQVLGLVGNTGASSEPHLHFHVADRPSPLFSEGVPYVFRDFQLEARVIGLETGEPSIVPADPPLNRQRQLPLNGDILAFPPG